MILCIDVGNSQLYGGVFEGDHIVLRFRHASRYGVSSDELGLFLRGVLREHDVDAKAIESIVYCSVVPQLDYALRAACFKYFKQDPMLVHAGLKSSINLCYRCPEDLGSDRWVNAIAAAHLYPNRHLIIVDFGTATTLCVMNRLGDYLGGVIAPGFRLSVQALQANTAKLPFVEIAKPTHWIADNTVDGIQAGVFYTQLAMVQYLSQQIASHYFPGETVFKVATGGFSHLFQNQGLFDTIHIDLVLHGLRLAWLHAQS